MVKICLVKCAAIRHTLTVNKLNGVDEMIKDVKRAYMETDLDWDWERVECLDVFSIHDAEWLVETPNFTAIGTYSCGELVEIRDIEVKKNEN